MVIRPSSSQWSVSPETIMSHHYRLTKGVKPVIDMSPPYSMYNSPISIHYIPRRAQSADAVRRNNLPKPHRELSAFINNNMPTLKLPLPLRSSRNELVKPTLLGNRNYHPPTRRPTKKPPLPVPVKIIDPPPAVAARNERRRERYRNTNTWISFKDSVYSYIIQRGVYTDSIIVDTVESEMEKWETQLPWAELELLREEIYSELGVTAKSVAKHIVRRPSSVDSAVSSGTNSTSSKSSSEKSNNSRKPSSSYSSSSKSSSDPRSKSTENESSRSSSEASSAQSSSDSESTN